MNAPTSESYPDPLITLPVTPEAITKAREIEAYNLGVSAYLWGYPLVRMERVIREYIDVQGPQPGTSYRAPLNRIGWATELATADAKDMPAANNDTFYMSAVLNLTEPYVLSVPDTNDRYYVVNVFNMYHEDDRDIGRRATGTKAGRFALVPPGWSGTLPEGIERVDVATGKVWLWGRLHTKDGESPGIAHELQTRFDVRPLSQIEKPEYVAPPAQLPPMPSIAGNDLGFFVHLGFAMQHNPVLPRDAALVGQLERIGLTSAGFDPSRLSAEQLGALRRAQADAEIVAASAVATTAKNINGWDWTIIDGYGFNYPLRAVHCGPYLGGNMAREAAYPSTYFDADGNILTGANKYELRFAKAPPVDAFWSLTVYHADDKMLVANPIDRYKVGSETPGLKIDADGSFTIPIRHDEPDGPWKANWLPVPEGAFFLVLRFYQPRPELLQGSYEVAAIEKVG